MATKSNKTNKTDQQVLAGNIERKNHSRGYIVVQRDAGEIKERLRMLAIDDKPF